MTEKTEARRRELRWEPDDIPCFHNAMIKNQRVGEVAEDVRGGWSAHVREGKRGRRALVGPDRQGLWPTEAAAKAAVEDFAVDHCGATRPRDIRAQLDEARTIVWELAEELLDADCPSHGDVPVSIRDCTKGPCNRIAAMCPRRHALTRARKAGIIGEDG